MNKIEILDKEISLSQGYIESMGETVERTEENSNCYFGGCLLMIEELRRLQGLRSERNQLISELNGTSLGII